MDEQTLQIILEAYDKASPTTQKVTKELKAAADQAKNTREAIRSVFDGSSFGGSTKGISGAKLLSEAKRQADGIINEQKRAAREAERLLKAQENLRHLSAMRQAREDERLFNNELRLVQRNKKAKEDAEKEFAAFAKSVNNSLTNGIIADQKKQVQAVQQAARARRQAQAQAAGIANGVFGGARGVVGGVGSLAGTVLSAGRSVVGGVESVLSVGQSILGRIGDELARIRTEALLAVGALTAVGAATAHAGIEFNQFKQNTLLTLTTLTKSAKEAKGIFDFAFKLAIPAKFTFEEVLEGARTLEAFGLHLDAYGQRQGRFLTNAVALAQGMEKPLEQVTRFLGNLSQGRLLLQQAAPLGLGRNTLEHYGASFDSRGVPKDRNALLEAAMRAIEDRWGGLIERMRNTYESSLDSMVSMARVFAGKVTEGLFGSLAKSFRNVSDLFSEMLGGKDGRLNNVMQAFKVVFDLVGKAIEKASEALPGFVRWLGEIVNREKVVSVIASVVAYVRMMADDVKRFLGLATGGKGLIGIWQMFREAAGKAIEFVTGAWGGFMGGLEYIATHGKEIWQALTEGAKGFLYVLETIIGLMALNAAGGAVRAFPPLRFGPMPGGGTNQAAMFPGDAMLNPFGGGSPSSIGGGKIRKNANGEYEFTDLPPGTADRLRYESSPAFRNRSFGGKILDSLKQQFLQDPAQAALRGAHDLGHQVILQAGRLVDGSTPDSVKNLVNGFLGAVSGGRDRAVANLHGAYPEYYGQAVRDINGLLNPKAAARRRGADALAPSIQLYGAGGGGSTGPQPRSPEIIDAMLAAYEQSIRGYSSDAQAGLKTREIPFLNERAYGERGVVAAALAEMQRTHKETGDLKDETDQQKDVVNYWNAVKALWKTQGEIMEIQKNAVEAVAGQMKEANEAREQMVRAQAELLPESQKSQFLADRIVPVLRDKQQDIYEHLKRTQQGTKEYYQLWEEGYRVEKEIADLRGRATEDMAKKAFEGPQRQFSTLQRLLKLLPAGQQRAASQQLLLPRLYQMYQAAQGDPDPESRSERLLQVADAFSELRESNKASDPFHGMFDRSAAAQRALAFQAYRARLGQRGRGGIGALRGAFASASPFAQAGGFGGAGGAMFGGNNFNQLVFNLPVNATADQIADLVAKTLRDQFAGATGGF